MPSLGWRSRLPLRAAMSLLWTVSYSATLQAVVSYVQLLGSLWVVREFTRTPEQRRSLLVAFCLGSFVPMFSLLGNFMTGVEVGHGANVRYTATGQMPMASACCWCSVCRSPGT